jgi:micrococcal nuclease
MGRTAAVLVLVASLLVLSMVPAVWEGYEPVIGGIPLGAAADPGGACAPPSKPPSLPTATITRVVDGDTVLLRFPGGHQERTRLIGIDTPEVSDGAGLERDVKRYGRDEARVQALGQQASALTRRLLPRGTRVEVEHDVQDRDRHGRLLAYLWTPDAGLVNLVIMREGYARVITVPPNVRYEARFRACQREARAAERGLWRRVGGEAR